MPENHNDFIGLRRSIYHLDSQINLSKAEIESLITHALKEAPSAFNSQSGRLVVLLQNAHKRFWTKTLHELKAVAPQNTHASLEEKISSFAKAYGTILFFEDESVVTELQTTYPLYKDKFPDWSQQANGMLQFAIWSLFAQNQIGASLQHYSPLVENFIYKDYDLPTTWKLYAQMPFGRITAPVDAKEYTPIETRLLIKE